MTAKRVLPYLSWIKFSVDAGKSETYARLHGTKKEDFNLVTTNISRASFLNRLSKWNCTIGVQSILFKENIDDLPLLAKFLKFAKPDYFVVKPFSYHTDSLGEKLEHPTDDQVEKLIIAMQEYREDYEFIYREQAFSNVDKCKPYGECYGRDFVAHIDTLGNVHNCVNFVADDKFTYGNIYNNTFKEIWDSRQKIDMNMTNCRTICRLDNINRYLWRLKNPSEHDNYI